MKWRLLGSIMLAAAPLFLGACASTFVAYKDGHGYYIGNQSDSAYKLFCDSGDFRKILDGTTRIAQDTKEDLYRYNCGTDRSPQKIREIYASMTPEQRKDLRTSFKNNGYEINYLHC